MTAGTGLMLASRLMLKKDRHVGVVCMQATRPVSGSMVTSRKQEWSTGACGLDKRRSKG